MPQACIIVPLRSLQACVNVFQGVFSPSAHSLCSYKNPSKSTFLSDV